MNNARMPRRGSFVALLAGLMTTALVATGAVQSNAAPLISQSSAAESSRAVLSSEFGKATSRIQGTFGRNGTVTGSFKPREFRVSPGGTLKAVGRLTATLTRGNGNVVGTTSERVVLPVMKAEGQNLRTAAAAAAADCEILNLVLGPLDLDLLGLKVHLDRVVLNITASPGSGNLLGNLLCAVAGLLDTPGVLTQISQILNSILAILRL